MQLAALPECKPFYVGLNEEINVHAVRAFNCTSEFEMLENLDNLLQNKASIPFCRLRCPTGMIQASTIM